MYCFSSCFSGFHNLLNVITQQPTQPDTPPVDTPLFAPVAMPTHTISPAFRHALFTVGMTDDNLNHALATCRRHFLSVQDYGVAHGLTTDEIYAVLIYTCNIAGERFTQFYFILNQTLRGADPVQVANLRQYMQVLMVGLSRLPSVTTTVYRGMTSYPGNDVFGTIRDEYLLNTLVYYRGFTSTTPTRGNTDAFNGSNGALLIITIRTGRAIRELSCFPTEDEVLLAPGCFRVTRPLYQVGTVNLVEIEEVENVSPTTADRIY